jgi:hypothetical protein
MKGLEYAEEKRRSGGECAREIQMERKDGDDHK